MNDQKTIPIKEMPRNPLPPGTWGKIKTYKIGQGKYKARCRYRDSTGKIHFAERTGTTSSKAANALREALSDWVGPSYEVSGATKIKDIADSWIEDVGADVSAGRTTQTTYDRYQQRLKQWIIPALGELRAQEVATPKINQLLSEVRRKTSDANARTVRTALSNLCAYAVRQGAMTSNPVRDAISIRAKAKPVKALTSEQVIDILNKLDADDKARHQDLPDLMRFLVATGERIGEALAARWCDVDEVQHSLSMEGNVIRTSVGLIRNDGKTHQTRSIPLPAWCIRMLADRRDQLDHKPDDRSLIFPSSKGTIREPANFYNRAWNPFKRKNNYDWVTPHTFRKTVATLLDQSGMSAREIADILGHARPSMTQDVYMGRGAPSKESARVLDQLDT